MLRLYRGLMAFERIRQPAKGLACVRELLETRAAHPVPRGHRPTASTDPKGLRCGDVGRKSSRVPVPRRLLPCPGAVQGPAAAAPGPPQQARAGLCTLLGQDSLSRPSARPGWHRSRRRTPLAGTCGGLCVIPEGLMRSPDSTALLCRPVLAALTTLPENSGRVNPSADAPQKHRITHSIPG